MTDLEIVKTAFDIISMQFIENYDNNGNIYLQWGDFFENEDKFDKDGNYIS